MCFAKNYIYKKNKKTKAYTYFFFLAGAFLAGAFLAGAFLAGAFLAGAFLAGAFFLAAIFFNKTSFLLNKIYSVSFYQIDSVLIYKLLLSFVFLINKYKNFI